MKFSISRRKKEKEEMLLRIAMQDVEIARFKTMAENYQELAESYREIVGSCHSREKKNIEKVQKLEKRNRELKLLIPTEFPVIEIMDSCAKAAWEGCHSLTKQIFESLDGKVKLFFEGTVYESSYEYFTAGCCVYYLEEGMNERKSLYTIDGRCVDHYRHEEIISGSKDAVREYLLRKNLGFKEVS